MNRDSPIESTREELIAPIAAQAAEIAALQARIAELERRLGLDSSNSSKPPSSAGPRKPARTSSFRQASNKKTGGQKGHTGETLRRTQTPDLVAEHHPPVCSEYGAALTQNMSEGRAARQVRPTKSATARRRRASGPCLSLRKLRRKNARGS